MKKTFLKITTPNDYGFTDYNRMKSQSPKSNVTVSVSATRDATNMTATNNDGTVTPISVNIINETGSVIIGTDRPKSSSFRANFNTLIGQKAMKRLMNHTHLNYDLDN